MSQRTQPQPGTNGAEQPILRTASGEIDFEAYYERARAARAEAHREMMAATVALWRRWPHRSSGKPVVADERKFARP